MSDFSTLIIEYTGNYNPKNFKLFEQACSQVRRWVETEVGQFEILTQDTQKVLISKVTRVFISNSSMIMFNSWHDQGNFSVPLGLLWTNTYTKKKNGDFAALGEEGEVLLLSKGKEAYAYLDQDPKGAIEIGQIESTPYSFPDNQYKGVGTGLMQLAIELSIHEKCPGKVFFTAIFDSHGFHRKNKFDHIDPEKNKKIDEEVERAKKENRQPKTSAFSGTMLLNPSGFSYWEKIIKEKPVLF